MPNTEGRWTADTPFPDMEIFVGASSQSPVSPTFSGNNLIIPCAAATATAYYWNVPIPRRTGITPTDPRFMVGFPPYQGNQVPTLTPQAGAIPKGIKINSVDFIYTVTTNPLSALSVALYAFTYPDQQNFVTTNIIAAGQNGLPLAVSPGGNPYRKNVAVANPAFIISPGTDLQFKIAITTPAGGTAAFYGMVLKCSYNFC